MSAWKETPQPVEAEVVPFPLAGFILGDHLCAEPSANAQELCFDVKGHKGDHAYRLFSFFN